MDQWLAWAGTALSVFVTGAGFYMAWRRYQAESLRSRDVAAWADRAIVMLLTVELCARVDSPVSPDERRKRLHDSYFALSALTEQGRIFFVNIGERDGARASGAYTGRRPRLLDPLVIAHKAAARMIARAEEKDERLHALIVQHRKAFIAHVQSEIGRRQSIAKDSRKGGETADLDAMLAAAA